MHRRGLDMGLLDFLIPMNPFSPKVDPKIDGRLPNGITYSWVYQEGMDSSYYAIRDIEESHTQVTYQGYTKDFYWRKDGGVDENQGMRLGGDAYDHWRETLWSLKREGAVNKEEYDKEILHRIFLLKKWKDKCDREIREKEIRYKDPNARPTVMANHEY
jgi:hypothetical protein